MIRCILAICGLIAADQAVKWYTVSHLTLGETAPLLPGLVELLRVHNYGAAWSSFSGMRWLLIVVTAAVMAVLAVLLLRRMVRHPLGVTALVLILGGGVGNLIDRIRLGYVVDMFHFQFWPSYPVFNVADIFVVAGVILFLLYYLFLYEKTDGKKTGANRTTGKVRRIDGTDSPHPRTGGCGHAHRLLPRISSGRRDPLRRAETAGGRRRAGQRQSRSQKL